MKKIIIVMVVAILVAWLSMNWVQGQELFSNPFAKPEIAEQLKSDAYTILENSRDALDKGVEKVKESIQ